MHLPKAVNSVKQSKCKSNFAKSSSYVEPAHSEKTWAKPATELNSTDLIGIDLASVLSESIAEESKASAQS